MEKNRINVLLVEDDEDDYIITGALLSDIERVRYNLEWVATYEEALPIMTAGEHDICLVDYRLGAHNGLDLIREAIANGCNKPMILLTGQGGMEVDLEAMEMGVADYLVKGKIDSQLLERSIRFAIEHKQREEQLRDQREFAEALRDTAAAINSTLDINEILDHILTNLSRVVPHDAAGIMLIEDGVARVSSQRGYEKWGIEGWISGLSLVIDETPNIKRMIKKFQPDLCLDTTSNPDWITFPENSWIKSYLGAPIQQGDTVIGIINLDSETPNFFTDEHVSRLQSFSDQVSVALEKASLYQKAIEAADRRAALHDVSQEIVAASRSPERVFTAVHEATKKLMPCEAFVISTTNGAKGRLEAIYLSDRGKRYPPRYLFEEGCLSGEVIKNGQSIIIDDLNAEKTVDTVQFGEGESVRAVLAVPMQLNGKTFGMISTQSYRPNAYSAEDKRLLEMLAAYAAATLESARLFADTQRHAWNQEMMNEITQTALAVNNPESVMTILAEHFKQLMKADNCFITVWDAERGEALPGAIAGDDPQDYLSLRVEPGEVTLTASVLEAGHTIIVDNVSDSPYIPKRIASLFPTRSMMGLPLVGDNKKIGAVMIGFNDAHEFTADEVSLAENVAAHVSLALAKIKLLDETKQRAAELEAVADVSKALRVAEARDEMPPIILSHLSGLLQVDGAALVTIDPQTSESVISYAQGSFEEGVGLRVPAGEGLPGHVIATGQPYVARDAQNDPHVYYKDLVKEGFVLASAPLIVQGNSIGAVIVGREQNGSNGKVDFDEMEIRLLNAVIDIAANGLHRAELHDRTAKQLERLSALHEVDMAISASFDIKLTLNTLINRMMDPLDVDAVSVLVLDADLHRLEHAASRGFRTKGILSTSLQLGDALAGLAALDRQPILVDNLIDDGRLENFNLVNEEEFTSYYAFPLISKGIVYGVLELFNREVVARGPEWVDFVETIATQASIAINNTELYDEAQRSNMELSLAYDATIEGWAKALELRDMETEGHSRRVVELAMQLANKLGIKGEELAHIRRGALLHDIGKMGVPDAILQKPGKLTDEEWEIMKQHPVYAYDWLSSIEYLKPALDIPYCHHEKWDGSGYPKGLKGSEIPIAARIFAIIDVYDALGSDRPYRKAWPQEKIREYLQEESGKHFDPEVVDAFLELLGDNSAV
jgi:response regulator RpfG family c-di-GMP phosphodiesterase/putative methionine-R-sulfoxide reductase with GAF domain